ncbi:glycoside hydrolase family 76 protein [Cohnella silvisoli]|uniref:Glycoside hydrolase family 76 protein n=1 Tax=Cohnella silvisoli TaxID=2873699 RepID=A0ABV1KMP2_9BACL|nr:glycoside hydrolase family 76 protein [Cohnella silvisoli]MCD9020453.1 glycosyl hydrolase [Cohnella silvisoli]
MIWANRADQAQQALENLYWNPGISMYDIEVPCPNGVCNTIFHYWWMAHAADALVDGLNRTGDRGYSERLVQLHTGVRAKNGGSYPNLLYDDMEWMGISWLRAYESTGNAVFKETVLELWEDIKTGWNPAMGGGIAWHKEQLGYKNTPANGPAIILAARLARQLGDPDDLVWAEKIYVWLKNNLVDPETGFVWDGMNRNGDGEIDKDWKFTYCQGVFIGAAVELYRVTGDLSYLHDASRTAKAAIAELTDPVTGLLPDEEDGDGGLFKGIFVRYLAELVAEKPDEKEAIETLRINAVSMWDRGRGEGNVLFSTDWSSKPSPDKVTLSAQLSGIFLLERMAVIEKGHKIAESMIG